MMFIALEFQLSWSMISMILKDKKGINNTVKSKASIKSKVITEKRAGDGEIVMSMEDLVHKNMHHGLLAIQVKARLFKPRSSAPVTHATHNFTASNGWFQHLLRHHNFPNVKVRGEAACANHAGAEAFKEELNQKILEEKYMPEQIGKVNKTTLFWKHAQAYVSSSRVQDNAWVQGLQRLGNIAFEWKCCWGQVQAYANLPL